MNEELDPFDFGLAEQLGMTVQGMSEAMSNAEYLAWRAFHVYRKAMADMDRG